MLVSVLLSVCVSACACACPRVCVYVCVCVCVLLCYIRGGVSIYRFNSSSLWLVNNETAPGSDVHAGCNVREAIR